MIDRVIKKLMFKFSKDMGVGYSSNSTVIGRIMFYGLEMLNSEIKSEFVYQI